MKQREFYCCIFQSDGRGGNIRYSKAYGFVHTRVRFEISEMQDLELYRYNINSTEI